MFQAIVAITAGVVLLSQIKRGALRRLLTPFATLVGLIALFAGFSFSIFPLNIALFLAGLVLAMNTLYAVPSVGTGLKEIGLWLGHFRFPLGLANLVLGLGKLL